MRTVTGLDGLYPRMARGLSERQASAETGDRMEFRMLGQVEVSVGGRPVGVGPPQQQLVVAALALEAGRTVATDRLIDRVWDDAPPQARRTLHVQITRIRRSLEKLAPRGTEPVKVLHDAGGYRLTVCPERVDALRFRALLAEAREPGAAGDARVGLLREVVGLWHGQPLAGLPGRWAADIRTALTIEYLDGVVAWARAELLAGNPAAVVGPLSELAGAHPLVESVAAMLMRILSALGRPAEALVHYATVRQRLADQLGADPGPELQSVYRAILRGELGSVSSEPAGAAALEVVDRSLPADVGGFVGREEELRQLIAAAQERSPTITVHAVDGMAGIGKTAFAVHAAHQLATRFPDGQRFVALRAHAPGQAPVDPAAALETLLEADGVPARQIPVGLDARAALWRARVAGKRLLLVLDDAADADHIAALLPAAPGCLVLITSRRKLATVPGAAVISLDTLPPDQAAELFVRRAGRGGGEPAAVAKIAALCGYLPLAIALTAARLHTHPAWSMTDLVDELGAARDRLAELASGELAVAAAFDLSYRELPPARQRLFRRLGLHPGFDLDAYAAAALDGSTLAEARRGLEELLEHNLLLEPRRGRFRFHDLIAAHARSLAARDPRAEQDSAVDRLVGRYLVTASIAATYLPREIPPRGRAGTLASRSPAPSPSLATPRDAVDWFKQEQWNLAAATGWAAARRHPAAVAIPTAMHEYLRIRGHWTLACDLHRAALGSATDSGDLAGQAQALINLADTHRLTGDCEDAVASAQRSLDLFRQLDDEYGQAAAVHVLGCVRRMAGDGHGAVVAAEWALDRYRHLDDPYGQAIALTALSRAHLAIGAGEAAAAAAERALDLYRKLDDEHGRAGAMALLMALLSELHMRRDDYAAAVASARTAFELFEQVVKGLNEADGTEGGRGDEPSPPRGPGSTPLTIRPRPAPATRHGVGLHSLTVRRGDRTLPVAIWYPTCDGYPETSTVDQSPADGEFPVVLFSHGLNAAPDDYRRLLAGWAAAGFVVAAPTYPSLSRGAAEFNLLDVVNYPADASAVLTHLLGLDASGTGLLHGHLDAGRVAAAGHSVGGITTVGLFACDRDQRLAAGIVLAGEDLGVGDRFTGASVPVFYVHGDRDSLISYASGWRTFEQTPWPKAFLTLRGGSHTDPYVDDRDPAFPTVAAMTTDFLRLSLYGDSAARTRFSASMSADDSFTLDNRL